MLYAQIKDWRAGLSIPRAQAQLEGSAAAQDAQITGYLLAAEGRINTAGALGFGDDAVPFNPFVMAPSEQLQGTVDTTDGLFLITGTLTTFLEDYVVGRGVRIGGEDRVLATVTDDFTATVTEPWGADNTGAAHVIDFEIQDQIAAVLRLHTVALALPKRIQQADMTNNEAAAISECEAWLLELAEGRGFPLPAGTGGLPLFHLVLPTDDRALQAREVDARNWEVHL